MPSNKTFWLVVERVSDAASRADLAMSVSDCLRKPSKMFVLGDGEAHTFLLAAERRTRALAAAGTIDLFVTKIGGHGDARQEARRGHADALGGGGNGALLGPDLRVAGFEKDEFVFERLGERPASPSAREQRRGDPGEQFSYPRVDQIGTIM